jgi:hypothetical protein
LGGSVELRPTLTSLTGELHTENTVELALQLTQNTKVSYVQYFNTNLYSPLERKSIFRKLGFAWRDAYARVKFGNLWQSADKKTSFGIQERFYIPTAEAGDSYPSRIAQGMITNIRSYFSFVHKPNDFVELSLDLVPTVFISKKSGYFTGTKEVANPIYEHLINQETDLKITKKLILLLPLSFRATKYKDYLDNASLSDRWGYNLSALPELDWEFVPKQNIGIAFVTDNFLKADGTGANWGSAWKQGLLQILWNMTF